MFVIVGVVVEVNEVVIVLEVALVDDAVTVETDIGVNV